MRKTIAIETRGTRRRVIYVALALGTIAIGLFVHLRGTMLDPSVRDILGDALWAAMIVWWIGAVAPRARRSARYGISYAICIAVELSQMIHTPMLDAVRGNRFGHLVLGSGFDPRDFVAYAIGIVIAALLDARIVSNRAAS